MDAPSNSEQIDLAPRSSWQAAWAIHSHLDVRRRQRLISTFLLMIAGAVAELATIGAVLPFLTVVSGATGGRYARAVALMQHLASLFGCSTVAMSAMLLILVAIASAVIRLQLIWVSQNLVFAIAHDLASDIYDRTLHQPYAFHVAHNSSRTIADIEKVQFVLGNVFLPAMMGATAAVVSLFILAALLFVDPLTSVLACLCFGLLYTLVSVTTRRRLYRNADLISDAFQARVQALQEGLGGIREVLLDRSQPFFLDRFNRIDQRFRQAQAANQFIAAAPRYIVEAGGIILIAVLALIVNQRPGGIVASLPMLGALALGAQRLLPLIQQVYFSWSQIHGNRGALMDVACLLELPRAPTLSVVPVPFHKALSLDRVHFTYPLSTRPALSDVSLIIPKGARVGLVGRSGSGKSTLVDLLMGLLDPGDGQLHIDGHRLDATSKLSWQSQIAHVPQAIFLADCSIEANIAFGQAIADIDRAQIEAAARGAGLHEFITSLPDGYDTKVGERGVRLSGGQRQRIGIARALYRRASVLILDEATSALDHATETLVMDSIAKLSRDLTIISIAHRPSTLRMCDIIVRLDDGRIVERGTYGELIADLQARS